MLEYGVTERWPARQCARKWQELNPQVPVVSSMPFQTPVSGPTPMMSQFSSPEDSGAYNYLPLRGNP